MKIELNISEAPGYVHFTFRAEAEQEEKDRMAQISEFLFAQLSAGKEGFLRRGPTLYSNKVFETGKTVFGASWRFSTTMQDGVMQKPAPIEDAWPLGFGLCGASHA